MSNVGEKLARMVSVGFVGFTGEISAIAVEQVDWASVTFTGARHKLRLTLDGDGAVGSAADFLEKLPDLDLPIRGHIVADIALVAEERGDNGRYVALDLEALTIEDR